MHHDDALGRLTQGSGRLDEMTSAELGAAAYRSCIKHFPRFTLLLLGLEPARPSIEIARPKLEASRLFPHQHGQFKNPSSGSPILAEPQYQVSG